MDARRRRPSKRSERSGFTLLELLLTMIIIGVIAAIASPSITAAMADRRTGQCALDVVRLFRRARGDTLGYGRAHVVQYTQTGTSGSFRVFRGTTQSCNNNDWSTLISAGCTAGSACVEEVNTTSSPYTLGAFTVQIQNSIGASYEICFQPNGATLLRTTGAAGRFLEQNPGSVPMYRLQTRQSWTVQGVARIIVVPYGGDARIRR